MPFAPDITELLARARADLRMGVPLVMSGEGAVLVMAAETLNPQRLADVLALGGEPVLAITARRAETLKARPYSDRLAPFAQWFRQLWAESLGKGGKGTTPINAVGTIDQHSQLQLYLDAEFFLNLL